MLHPRYVQPKAGLTWQKELQNKIATIFFAGRVVPKHTATEHFYLDTVDGKVYPSVTAMTGLLAKNHLKQWAANRAAEVMTDYINGRDTFDRQELLKAVEESRYAHQYNFNRASVWGSHGHDLVDLYVQRWLKTGKKPDLDILSLAEPDISNEGKCAALGAMKFFSDYTLFPIVSESKVISKKYGYAGTLDSLWLIGEVYKGRVGEGDCRHEWLEKRFDTIHCARCNREEKLSIILVDLKTSNQIFGYGDTAHFDYAAQTSAYASALKEMTGVACKQIWVVRLEKKKPHYEIGMVTDPKGAFELFKNLSKVGVYIKSGAVPLEPLVGKKKIIVI